MSTKVGTNFIIEETPPAKCELCGEVSELRPYGPDGKSICINCGDKDPVGTRMRMMASINAPPTRYSLHARGVGA